MQSNNQDVNATKPFADSYYLVHSRTFLFSGWSNELTQFFSSFFFVIHTQSVLVLAISSWWWNVSHFHSHFLLGHVIIAYFPNHIANAIIIMWISSENSLKRRNENDNTFRLKIIQLSLYGGWVNISLWKQSHDKFLRSKLFNAIICYQRNRHSIDSTSIYLLIKV